MQRKAPAKPRRPARGQYGVRYDMSLNLKVKP